MSNNVSAYYVQRYERSLDFIPEKWCADCTWGKTVCLIGALSGFRMLKCPLNGIGCATITRSARTPNGIGSRTDFPHMLAILSDTKMRSGL